MPNELYNIRVCRFENGKPLPANGEPDAQIEAVIRDLNNYLVLHPPGAAGGGAAGAGNGTALAPDPGPTAIGLAQFLLAGYPGASVAASAEHYWYITPLGMRIWVCIGEQVVLTQQVAPAGPPRSISPPIRVGFEMTME